VSCAGTLPKARLWQAVNRLSLPRKHYGPAISMFRWTGWRKNELSDLRSRSEHAPVNGRPALAYLQAKSTAQSANREESSELAFGPGATCSRVDLGRRIPAKCAFFGRLKRESRKLKARWRRLT
jgi:hypothetical protein